MEDKKRILEELCETITKHLQECNDRLRRGGDMSVGDIDIIDKLTHSLKSIKTTLAMMEAEEDGGNSRRSYDGGNSMRMYPMGYDGGRRSYDGGSDSSYDGGMSGRRGRDSMGRYVSRDGGYSTHDGLEDIMMDIRNMPEHERKQIKQMLERM